MKNLFLTVTLLLVCIACSGSDEQSDNEQAAFFASLTSLCGTMFEGETVYPEDPNHELAGAELLMTVTDCNEQEIRIPFQVDDDKSRTWVITYSDDELRLKHDHRYADGTPHSLTNYGGIADREKGTSEAQYFAADTETSEMLPEASGNVWMMKIDGANKIFVYDLEREGEPRYRAEFRLD